MRNARERLNVQWIAKTRVDQILRTQEVTR